jgi:drug/metabolite transporter (DMT)-like permease
MSWSLACLVALPLITGLGSVLWSQLAGVSWRLPCLANVIAYVITYAIVVASDLGSVRTDVAALSRSDVILWMGGYVAVCIACSLLWLFALRDCGVAAIGFVEIGYPVFILLFAFLLVGDFRFNAYHWIGGAIVLAGTSIVLTGNMRS